MGKITVNNWEYEIIYNNYDLPNLIVKPDPSKNIISPITLSKYYSLNHNNISAFLNNSFYIAQPENFNDLFDFNPFAIDFSNFEFEDIERIFLISERPAEFNKFMVDSKAYMNSIKNTVYLIWTQNFGVFCLTAQRDNDLMWAHYSDNNGFLIEYDYSKFPINFLGPFPINYIPEKSKLDFL